MICAHPPCTCLVDETVGYCAPECRTPPHDATPEMSCRCGHDPCTAAGGQGLPEAPPV